MPFLIADGTSFAFPTPNPTTPRPSPTTTRALKLRFLPPLTTLVTRLIDTTVSLISSCAGSIFSRIRFIIAIYWTFLPSVSSRRAVVAARRASLSIRDSGPCFGCAPIPLKLQTGFARGVGDRLHASVIEKPVAVEHHPRDALLEQPLRDRLADRLRAGDV